MAAPQRSKRTKTTDSSLAGRLERAYRALEAQNALLKQIVAIYDQMTAMVLQGADIQAISGRLAELIELPVAVFDSTLEHLASAVPPDWSAWPDGSDEEGWSAVDPLLAESLASVAQERRPVRLPSMSGRDPRARCVVAPIVVGDDVLGYLTIFEGCPSEDGSDLDLLVVQQAATVYALALMRQRMSAEVANQLREDLLDGLLVAPVGNQEETRKRAELLGYDASRTYRVLCVVPEVGTTVGSREETPSALALRRRVLEATVAQVGDLDPRAIAVARKEEAVVLAQEPSTEAPGDGAASCVKLGEALLERLRRLFPSASVTVGVGGPCREPVDVALSYGQARRAVATATRFGRNGKVTACEDLGIYSLLFQVPNQSELRNFAEQVLGRLVAYDERHQADLVKTLAAYLRYQGSLQHAARELVVHVNTVGYRLQRIQEIAGLDLTNADDRLAADVALKILDALEPASR